MDAIPKPTFDQVLEQALALPEKDRAVMSDLLLGSVSEEVRSPHIDQMWMEVAQRRLRECREGKVQAIDGEAALAQVRRAAGL